MIPLNERPLRVTDMAYKSEANRKALHKIYKDII